MDLVNIFLDLVAPPTTLLTLFLFLPPFYFFKLFLSFFSTFFPENMANKVVLITGASSGIGEQIAYQFAKKGAFLVIVARREGSLRQVAEIARELGAPEVLVIPSDVSKPDDCKRFIDETMDNFGQWK